MSGPRTDAARVVDECQQALAHHRLTVETAQRFVKLLQLGQSSEEVAAVVLDKLCDGEADAQEYLAALSDFFKAAFGVLQTCVAMQACETEKMKGMK